MSRAWLALAVVLPGMAANAGPAEEGTELARQGRYAEAIDQFKAADRLHESAANACLIALAYTRRELWPQAEIWLDTCRARATAVDPLPDWFDAATQQIHARLAGASIAAVELVVEPSAPGVRVSVSSFALDEKFAPRTIHLPFGRYSFVASAPGYDDGRAELVVADKAPKRVVIELHRPLAPVRGPRALRIGGWVAGGAGIVVLGAGVAFGLAARADADMLSIRTDQWTPADKATFADGQTANRRAIAAYVVGGALVAAGGVMYYLGARHHLEPVITERGVALAGRF